MTGIDFSTGSLSKFGEESCGNIVDVVRNEDGVTALFADGEGDGTGASVTASFYLRMAKILLQNGSPAASAVRIIAETCSDTESGGAPGFTAVQMNQRGDVSFSLLNMPAPILISRRKTVVCPCRREKTGAGSITTCSLTLRAVTTLFFFNWGLLHAGRERGTGWGRHEIELFLQGAYKPGDFSAAKITRMLLFAAKSLEKGKPSKDISVLTLQYDVPGRR